ncbi:MAG: glycine cleavage T C-terminal barrel domain-containing protein, partial [Anaerovorax sp.]|nr:glycine cleavage T C-terminal barrel domain-containing protein [Anaerovorax sp.]
TPYAMALLDMEYTEPGTRVQVEVRGRMLDAEVVELPFYKKDERK